MQIIFSYQRSKWSPHGLHPQTKLKPKYTNFLQYVLKPAICVLEKIPEVSTFQVCGPVTQADLPADTFESSKLRGETIQTL